MRKQQNSGSRLFFIEFIIVLFFFMIVSAVSLRLFTQANAVTRRSNALFGAQTAVTSFSSVLEATDGSIEQIATYFPEAIHNENQLIIFYDRDFHEIELPAANLIGSEKSNNILEWVDELPPYTSYLLIADFTHTQDFHDITLDIRITDLHENIIFHSELYIHKPLIRKEILQ